MFDTRTLALIMSIVLMTQVVALLVQYKVGSQSYQGISWWLVGSSLMAMGFAFMPLLNVELLQVLALFANPLVFLGQMLLHIGILRFTNRRENRWGLGVFLFSFLLSYYFFFFIDDDLFARSLIINAALSIMALTTSFSLYTYKDKFTSLASVYTATIFLIHGLFFGFRFLWTLSIPVIQTYTDYLSVLNAGFLIPTITTTLWTFGYILMINQRLNIESQLAKEKMQLVFDTSPDAAIISRLSDGRIVDVNENFTILTGYRKDDIINESVQSIIGWKNESDQHRFLEELNQHHLIENMEFIFHRQDQKEYFGSISARIIQIESVPHIVSVLRDITQRKEAEVALIESEEQYRSILNASPDDITITDLEGNILMISPAAKRMFGFDINFDSFVGKKLLDFLVPTDVERAKRNIRLIFEEGPIRPNEYRAIRKDHSVFDIEVNSGLIRNAVGEPIKMVFIIRDITERKSAEMKINELVHQLEMEKNIAQVNSVTDSLTGLSNRRYFDETIKNEFYRLKRSGASLSLIMIDVDHFKNFNDHYGHVAGDHCLIRIGTLLKTIVNRAPDVVARYGGEEFVVILPETESLGARLIANRIRLGVEELNIPHVLSDTADHITISCGVISIKPKELMSPIQVVSLADEALYRAKHQGRNQIVVLNEESTLFSMMDSENVPNSSS